ncbi:hypothetical protein F2Q69_00022069 [Brassica cretica]|uniref:Serine-threonine/tyrosine-protein kinase catalytic domain-containing protein n=1 Tax=Brassica cretica TaxID=69181 RepID=A0A8S9QBS5_BRACR|nr:hypothetical protein F2Q69_00022069 [Brassica cretica]
MPFTNSAVFEFDLDTIKAETNEFSDLINQNKCKPMYKGQLPSGQEIAVNEMVANSVGVMDSFSMRSFFEKIKHKNLIHLLGFLCQMK